MLEQQAQTIHLGKPYRHRFSVRVTKKSHGSHPDYYIFCLGMHGKWFIRVSSSHATDCVNQGPSVCRLKTCIRTAPWAFTYTGPGYMAFPLNQDT